MDNEHLQKLLSNRLFISLAIVVLVLVYCFLACHFEFLESFENRSWDLRQQILANPNRADKKIKIIVIDQSSLDYFANEESYYWPWPRPLYSRVLQFLQYAGAKGVAFDILFTEGQSFQKTDDLEFSDSLNQFIPVVSASVLVPGKGNFDREKFILFREAQKRNLQLSAFEKKFLKHSGMPKYHSATLPIASVLEKSAAFGNVWARPDSDGIFRHAVPGGFLSGLPVLSLPFSLYNLTHLDQELAYNLEDYFDKRNRLTLRFHGPQATYETFPIADVINSMAKIEEGESPLVDPAAFKDSMVFIGVWASGLFDDRPTPLADEFKGVEINAIVLDNLINQGFIKRPGALYNTLIAGLFIIPLVLVLLYSKRINTHIYTALFFVSLFTAICFYAVNLGFWLNLVVPLSAQIVCVLAAFAFQYGMEGKERRFIKGAFSQYLSPAVIEQIIEDPTKLELGGDRRELTILFTDIAGFTDMSEKLDPKILTTLMNNYFSALTGIILRSGGTLDKYIGDAIMAFWNAPLSDDKHAWHAVHAAIDCQSKLDQLQVEFERDYGVTLPTRMGLHTGLVTVGNFGSYERLSYTIIGDSANLASRLEAANKILGTKILCSEATYLASADIEVFRYIGQIKLPGVSESIRVYEPLNSELLADKEFLTNFKLGRETFDLGKLEQAKAIFEKLKNDSVSKKYVERINLEMTNNDFAKKPWDPTWLWLSK